MRKQLYVPVDGEEVWREAEAAADADKVSLSTFTLDALRSALAERKRKRAAQGGDAE